jgi:hypothetical protein
MSAIEHFLQQLRQAPDTIQFEAVIAIINDAFDFSPVRFRNGDLMNECGQNTGSCKLLAFAKRYNLSTAETLTCFGDYYRDLLKHPDGTDHQNIRNFMRYGWSGVEFEQEPLAPRHQ